MRPNVAFEGRPRRLGGVQCSGGTLNKKSSMIVQRWSVSPTAIAGVRRNQRRLPLSK